MMGFMGRMVCQMLAGRSYWKSVGYVLRTMRATLKEICRSWTMIVPMSSISVALQNLTLDLISYKFL